MILHLLAQVTDLGSVLPQVGFGGTLLVVIIRWLNRVEVFITTRLDAMERTSAQRNEETNHVIRGLSKAMWMDLASRPYSEPFIKEEAKRMLDKLKQ